jgi:predicted MFS family arabinose efflux permease
VLTSTPRWLVAHTALRSALFSIPVITLFWMDQIGMTLTEIMVLQAIFGVTIVLLEFPTGYLADRIGYRRSLLAGGALCVLGWIRYATGGTFGAMVAAEVTLGAGFAFTSGADSALLYSALDAQGRAATYTRWEGRTRAAAQASEAASSAVGGYLYALAPRLPLWLQVPTALAALGAAAAMRDVPGPAPVQRLAHLRHAGALVRGALWHDRRLRSAIALSVVLGLSSFLLVWLIQPYMKAQGVPEAWFGPVWAGASLWLAGVSLATHRVVARLGRRGMLLACCLLVPVGYGLLAAGRTPWATAFYLAIVTLRGLQGPILAATLQADAPPGDRAAVLSLNAALFRLAFVVVGPPVGLLAERAGLPATFVVLGAGLAVASLATLAAFERAHAAPPP